MITIKALFTYNYGEEKMNAIKELGYNIIFEKEKGITYEEKFKDVDVLVCYNPFDTLDISKLENLKWIQLSSIGIDQVPKEYLNEKGLILTNNKGGYSIPIGEWVVLKALELLRNSRDMYVKQFNKKWKIDTSMLELYGKTIGFIGTGSIAKESAKRLKGFEVKILGLNTSGKDTEYFDKCFGIDDLKIMIGLCDIVVLTIPYTQKTHHLLNNEVFETMKNGSYLINVSRGSIIDEKHLINYLENGKIKGAALDVFEEEPLRSENPLWNLDNVIITPHNSWISEMRNIRRYNTIYENMKRFINGKDLANVVNLEKGY